MFISIHVEKSFEIHPTSIPNKNFLKTNNRRKPSQPNK